MAMKVAVLLSGGVDSSVALALLRQSGHEVTAFYLKIWLEDELASLGRCPWEEDLRYARAVTSQLGVPLEAMPFQREYYERVVRYTIDELKAGRTPSPDIFCNQRIKFGAFWDAVGGEFSRVASGHYARRAESGGEVLLKTTPDAAKDQTYFLAHLSREQISRAMFPLGDMRKIQVRDLARELGLATCDRKDSQGICFLGKIKFEEFAWHHLGERKGPILELESRRKLGEHCGYWFHTIGQRRGLGLSGGPWYVVAKDVGENVVYVSHIERMQARKKDRFSVADFNWITPPSRPDLRVKIRHGPRSCRCRLSMRPSSEEGRETGEVLLDEGDAGVAAGQYAVFYDEDVCLGCAKIQFDAVPVFSDRNPG
jgi:tRNA-specific 2-thiouridylase